jgi:hypothetical protein
MPNYLSSKAVVGSFFRRFGISNVPNTTIIEFIGEAVGLLGYGIGTDVEFITSTVNFYKATYPCDFIDIYNVYYNGKILQDKKCVGGFNSTYYRENPHKSLENELIAKINTLKPNVVISAQVEDYVTGITTKDKLINQILSLQTSYQESYLFAVNPVEWHVKKNNLIETSFEDGEIIIEYLTFAKDEFGYPLILDEIKYKTAIEYYCMYNLILGGYEHPALRLENITTLYETFMQRARNQNKKFTLEEVHDFKNIWTNMLANVDVETPYYSN